MKLDFTRVRRKLKNKSETQGTSGYVLNKDELLIAKCDDEKQCVQFFVETPEGVKLLVLAKAFKRKIGQNLNVTTVATLFNFDGVHLIQFVKSRAFKLEEDDMLKKHQICTSGSAEKNNDGLHVICEELGVDEVLTECFCSEDGQVFYIISEKERAIKGEKKE